MLFFFFFFKPFFAVGHNRDTFPCIWQSIWVSCSHSRDNVPVCVGCEWGKRKHSPAPPWPWTPELTTMLASSPALSPFPCPGRELLLCHAQSTAHHKADPVQELMMAGGRAKGVGKESEGSSTPHHQATKPRCHLLLSCSSEPGPEFKSLHKDTHLQCTCYLIF